MGYKNPCDAPSWVQDIRMTSELKSSYAKLHDWRKVVAAHLMPSMAYNMSSWNRKNPGNPTIWQYVDSVFTKANISIT